MQSVRGVAQPGSASDLGSEGRMFESSRPDHTIHLNYVFIYKKIFRSFKFQLKYIICYAKQKHIKK